MERVNGVVQHYPWGDLDAIPELLGVKPDGRPWAELWLGTHPNGPSTLDNGRPLADVSGHLPFLLKVLAARRPLSLQAHPSADRARHGHSLGLYPDPHPKPEMLCAVTTFDALCGVREPASTERLLREIGADELADLLAESGVGVTIESLYRENFDIASTIKACAESGLPEARLVTDLAAEFPGESSPVVTLLLNRILLKPTEAIFLGPGNLHAYLSGVGVEVMGASDNVVRGGLTEKHVDVDELLAIFDSSPLPNPLVDVTEVAPGAFRYETTGVPFQLWRVETTADPPPHSAATDELLIVTDGGDGTWRRGESVFLTEGESVGLPSDSTVFVAGSPT
jgi:mannose-6-phosphate isomerase